MAPNPSFDDDDDDFQDPICSQSTPISTNFIFSNNKNKLRKKTPISNTNIATNPHKKPKHRQISDSVSSFDPHIGVANDFHFPKTHQIGSDNSINHITNNSIESRLMTSGNGCGLIASISNDDDDEVGLEEIGSEEDEGELDLLLKLCGEDGDVSILGDEDASAASPICCPLCGIDISGLNDDQRQLHTNQCLDQQEGSSSTHVAVPNSDAANQSLGQVLDGSPVQPAKEVVDVKPVLEWLRNLGLAKYEEVFVREEIDWDTLQQLTEEDLYSLGVTAFGPRKKIIRALSELRRDSNKEMEKQENVLTGVAEETCRQVTTKLITDYFSGSATARQRGLIANKGENVGRSSSGPANRKNSNKNHVKSGKKKDIPPWCCIPETPFRVDAFKYLTRDCSHWFLTHFHMDHYQGLTKSFSHGKIYCSSITAKLVNLKLGIPWERLEVLPLNQKISIAGIAVTCFDANHCPGAIIILFELPNGKAVLHTGDFRFSKEMGLALQASRVHTLILDTTYCDPQYDFPKQEAVIQFVIEAIQAEAFNPKTLFLIGSYTIGKERLFLDIARVLHRKVYVTPAKLRLLECLELSKEEMQWLTSNEHESQIHVVPMWTLASFKRLKHLSNQYSGRFSLIVAFTPTGWSVGKGKKKPPGKRWQQGTIIRYEVPYSEHSSFSELKEFVKLVSPANIIPSVNNHGPESRSRMLSLLSA